MGMTRAIDTRMNGCERKRLRDVDIMSVWKLFSVLLIFSAFAASVIVSETSGAYGENVVALAVEEAEAAVVSAYEAVLDAEQAGAKVSGLLVRLNVAGEYLANAHIWLGLGDFDNATRLASLCDETAEEVRKGANELKNEAYGLRVTDLVVRMTGSIIGVVIIVFLSFLVWGAFRRRYHKRVLEMKAEVISGES